MKRRTIYLGDNPLKVNEREVEGAFVDLDGERFYCISHADRMPDFFMSIVSASDHWMFISSNGSLSAGRKNSESALFPYYSEDKILLRAFEENEDIHTRTASEVFQVFPSFVNEDLRRQAKTINFGIIYGMSAFGLTRSTG